MNLSIFTRQIFGSFQNLKVSVKRYQHWLYVCVSNESHSSMKMVRTNTLLSYILATLRDWKMC